MVRRSALRSTRRRPPFRACKLHQAFGEPGQALQRRLDLRGPRVGGRVARLRTKPLRLSDSPRQRGSQLVRCIGGKAALCLERLAQPGQQAVQSFGQRADFGRQIIGGNLREVASAARLEACTEPAQRIETEPDGQDDRGQRDGQNDQERQAEAHLDFPRNHRAMCQRLGNGNADRALKGRVAVEPVSCGLRNPYPS